MHYRLFGGLQVQRDDGPLELGPPKQRAVLAVLLVEAGRVVATDRIVELLWGEDAPKARTSLQAYISHLRRILDPEVLLTQPPGYRLAVERNDVDVFRFLELVTAGRTQLREGDASTARATLEDALALWIGTPIPEFADEPFAVDLHERLLAARVGAIETVAEADLALGDQGSAVSRLEAEAANHPLQERLHELLALALYRSGRQADALRTIDRVRRALADTAGLELGPDLRRLEADVLAHAPRLDRQAPAQDPRPAPTASASMLVGRDEEQRILAEALDRAERGQGGIAVVIGEPGIGKTRLLEALRESASTRGFSTAWARCAESGAAPPFWPITQISEQLRDAGVLGAEMVAPDDRDSDETAAARMRFELHRAVAARLARFDRPLLAVIDDIQWADPDSLRLLEHVAGELASTHVLIA
ncbi:MAG TPA: BREX system ATP-binding domain-containing protein, partial [Acidimicrobiales bacterium]|nr:BREX system ATP-binding domain-containing protein [Acidimicrobiales bacterium]